jgi:hypothetical protein
MEIIIILWLFGLSFGLIMRVLLARPYIESR